jgi:hypothetical protein
MNLRSTHLAVLALASALLCVTSLPAQTVPPIAPPAATDTLPVNHVDGGLFYNSYTSPGVSGWGAYSHKVGSGTYSYSLADVTPGSLKPFNPKVTTSSGLAQLLTTYGGWNVFGVGTVGLTSSVGASTPVGAAGTAGFLLIHPLRQGWTIDVPIRVIAGTGPPQYVFGIGFGWGK